MWYFLVLFIFQAIYLNELENDQEIVQVSGHPPEHKKCIFSHSAVQFKRAGHKQCGTVCNTPVNPAET